MERYLRMRSACIITAVSLLFVAAGVSPLRGEGIRTSTMGNCSIALDDENNRLNPYDFGRNPAFLIYDFDGEWIRMRLNADEESGELKRPYDPLFSKNTYASFEGNKRLNDRQVAWGAFQYGQLWQREQARSLELDPYNDPFYLTDATKGDFVYYGPSAKVDYSVAITPRVALGAGFNYEISTGLKDVYTRPQVIHNYFKGNLGVLVEANEHWFLGLTGRPLRVQNRTEFAKTDEGYDNQIFRYAGDSLYEVRSFTSYSIREILRGGEVGVQNFFKSDRVTIGTIFTYYLAVNKSRYGSTSPEEVSYFQDKSYDFKFLARYTPKSIPLVLGLSGRSMDQDGWAKRPRFPSVLLYDNPIKLRSLGAGASYFIQPLRVTISGDYVLNAYDIEANDFAANNFVHRDITQNIGRFGVEYSAYNVYSIRGGVEVTDYLIDRWLKLPTNIDRYRFTAGGSYSWHLWQIEAQLLYARGTREDDERDQRDLSGILWFTRLQ
ncbi:MAG: hypothetical protein PHD74_00360 [Candidatus Krumholzibacteria bacterium]|nr:hypothetical protein [Candidatus Krumholzibacteria bacterium]